MNKKIISAVLAVLFLLSSANASAISISSQNLTAAENFAMNTVTSFIASGDEIVTWDNTTRISSYIELYAPDDSLNGYIFRFETQGEPSGFMQIGVIDSSFIVMNLGFDGNDFLTRMIEYNDLPSSTLTSGGKAYYLGGFSYYIYGLNDTLIELATKSTINNEISDFCTAYDIYTTNITQNIENTNLSTNTVMPLNDSYGTTIMVPSLQAGSLGMKTMSYYSGYTNHCAPTAAANLVMYFKYGRGFFSGISSDPLPTFQWFYTNMETNVNKSGTSVDDIWEPVADYFATYSGGTTGSTNCVEWVTFSKIKSLIDDDIPLLLGIIDYAGTSGGHRVNVWGYNIGTSNNYLFITDNWTTDTSSPYTVSFSLVNISSYSYSNYVYVGLD